MLAALALSVALAQDDGKVTLPLSAWDQMLDAAERAQIKPQAPVQFLQVDRSIEGSFQRGVFSGTLMTTVYVPPGHEDLRVPVLDANASIARVELDGRTTSLLPEEGTYTVAVGSPGLHTVRVEFFTGRDDNRFGRHLRLTLPPSGPTALSIWLPEEQIEAELANGAVTGLRPETGGTRLLGQLDGHGKLELTWKGQHSAEALPAQMEVRESTLFTLHEALVRGVSTFDATLLEGETDRLVLRLPEGVEVVDVTGDAVLQWRTTPGALEVLFRYVVDDRAKLNVNFQLPVDLDQAVTLRMPLPPEGVALNGAIGVQGPAGLKAEVKSSTGAQPLSDLPPELAELTPNPLLLGFELTGEPEVVLQVTRQPDLQLSNTVIYDLEALTYLIEDGAEITKLQLHMRNQTRQYLSVKLPEGAKLTLARIDDRSVRPATSPDGDTLLIPLMQSEHLEAGREQIWVVRPDETLDKIADRVYGDPSLWRLIFDNNRDTLYSDTLEVGQKLRVPRRGDATATSFVVELAWTRDAGAMGPFGRRTLRLPEFDVDVSAAAWDVWVPETFYTLSFSGNLSPTSNIRYDHLRRLRGFLDMALDVQNAWAGGSDSYVNILSRRKSIYADEVFRGGEAQEVASDFPLVGKPNRFKRIFLGREVPELHLSWMSRDLLPLLRVGSLAAAAALVLGLLAGRSRAQTAAGFAGLLVVAWYVEGVHKSLLWGLDLGLIIGIGRRLIPDLSVLKALPTRAGLLDLWSYRNLGRAIALAITLSFLLWVPLLWSSLALIALTYKVRRLA